jgi:hypothetical protein
VPMLQVGMNNGAFGKRWPLFNMYFYRGCRNLEKN